MTRCRVLVGHLGRGDRAVDGVGGAHVEVDHRLAGDGAPRLWGDIVTSAVKRSQSIFTITEKALGGAFSVIVQLHRLIVLPH